jgi:hypothetical protein
VTISAYPLTWPPGFPRTKSRDKGAFQTTLPGALKNVETSLKLFAQNSGKAISGIVMSSNVTLGVSRPEDPGVAVWFTWDGLGLCIAVDRYATVEANLQAIHHIIEARRVELRHGTLALVRAMTINGGKPHAVGDKGQRYEVSFLDAGANCRRVLGWSTTIDGARSMASGVEHHPSWSFPWITDRVPLTDEPA